MPHISAELTSRPHKVRGPLTEVALVEVSLSDRAIANDAEHGSHVVSLSQLLCNSNIL